jgi:hypothetical protein
MSLALCGLQTCLQFQLMLLFLYPRLLLELNLPKESLPLLIKVAGSESLLIDLSLQILHLPI